MNGAESLVATLASQGVEVCFANPGTSEMHFLAALENPGIKPVLCLFEGVCTGAADGWYRMNDRPASTLLQQLQADVRANREPDPAARPADPDPSVQVHGCHSKSRQVEVLREVLTGMNADITLKRQEIFESGARAFAQRFTEPELVELAKFLKTPLGEKYTKQQPEAINDFLAQVQPWISGLNDFVIQRVRADMKKRGYERPLGGFRPIHMPRNTGAGVIIAGLATICGFALIWYIWWLAALSFVGVLAAVIIHTFNYDRDFHIPADEVVQAEDARTQLLGRA